MKAVVHSSASVIAMKFAHFADQKGFLAASIDSYWRALTLPTLVGSVWRGLPGEQRKVNYATFIQLQD
jgi:hypothetical protein